MNEETQDLTREVLMDKHSLISLLNATASTMEDTAEAFTKYFAGNGNGLTKDDYEKLHNDMLRSERAGGRIRKIIRNLETLSAEHAKLEGNG